MNKRKITRTAISAMLAVTVLFGTVGFTPTVAASEVVSTVETVTITPEQAEIERLTAELAKTTAERDKAKADLAAKTKAYNKLKKSYDSLKKAYNKMQAKIDSWHWKYLSKKHKWSKKDLRWAVKYDAKKHGLSKAEQEKLANAAVDIVFTGAHESGGSTGCTNGQYVGMFQFGKSWGSVAKRKSGTWSVHRYVKVYRDGGMAKIQQHWAATLGR